MPRLWFEQPVVRFQRKFYCLSHKPNGAPVPPPVFYLPKTAGCHGCCVCKQPGYYIQKRQP